MNLQRYCFVILRANEISVRKLQLIFRRYDQFSDIAYTHCCRSWGAQTWKLPGNVHMCPSQCPICAQHVYKLGHFLYTEATAWPPLVQWSCIHACAQAWAHVYISKQFPSLGTPAFTAVTEAGEKCGTTKFGREVLLSFLSQSFKFRILLHLAVVIARHHSQAIA